MKRLPVMWDNTYLFYELILFRPVRKSRTIIIHNFHISWGSIYSSSSVKRNSRYQCISHSHLLTFSLTQSWHFKKHQHASYVTWMLRREGKFWCSANYVWKFYDSLVVQKGYKNKRGLLSLLKHNQNYAPTRSCIRSIHISFHLTVTIIMLLWQRFDARM